MTMATEAVQDINGLELFQRDVAAAAREGQSITPVLKEHGVHPQVWADWRSIARGRMTRWRNGSQVSDTMRWWCRTVYCSVLEAQIACLQKQLDALND
jgi:hypothetical protein